MKTADMHKLLAYVSNLDAICGMKEYRFTEGKANGVKAVDLKNGKGIEMTVLADKCMDIPFLSYKGYNVGFTSKTGVVGPQYFVEEGAFGFLKQFDAGFLTTCGLCHGGGPSEENGRKYGLHGSIFNAPAENFCKEMIDLDGQAALQLRGTMTEASAFGENMKLDREITLETEANILHIHDTVTNWGFEKAPVMNVYHMNIGYPMLDEGDRLYVSAEDVTARDEGAQKGLPERNVMIAPVAGYEEQCFFYHTKKDSAYAMLKNDKLGIAVILHYDPSQIQEFVEWKNMMAGAYALGLEPSFAGVCGKEYAQEQGFYRELEPGESLEFDIDVEFTDDPEVMKQYMK